MHLALVIFLVAAASWLLSFLSWAYLGLRMGPPPTGPRPAAQLATDEQSEAVTGDVDPRIRLGTRDLPSEKRPPPPLSRVAVRLVPYLLIAVVLSVGASLWLSRRFARPLAALADGAENFRHGRLDHRVPLEGNNEFGRVAASMNQMAEQIADQIEALEADGQRRQQLLADVAHELRSPVATMKAMAEALRDGVASEPARSQRASGAIADSAARMERLVNDLLELARLDLHETPLERQAVDMRALATECLRRHAEAAGEADISIHPIGTGEPVMVEGDPHRLAQILDNLVDNAVSHAGPGAQVRVSLAAGERVTVMVADTGRGIPAEHIPYVFDPFYRGDAARTPGEQHSGLGLRIARGLAEAHGGTLAIESTEGRGTQVTLTLPSRSATV